MDNSRYKSMKIYMTVLLVLSLGLFLFQNFGMKWLEQDEYTNYYVANTDIAPFEKIDSSMFTAVEIETDSVPQGVITNFSDYEGSYYTNGIMKKGDILTEGDLTTEDDEAGMQYTIEITSDYSGPLQYDDYVDIYTLDKDNVTNILFTGKKLHSADGNVLVTAEDGTTTEQAVDKKYIKVTKQELLDYYSKLKSYSIIVVPIEESWLKNMDTNTGNSNVEIDVPVQNEVKTFDWEVQEGETWTTLAEEWDLTESELQRLNPGVKELEVGMTIKLPQDE